VLVEDHARRIKELLDEEQLRPRAVVADPADAEGRATMERHLKMKTTAATKDSVLAGVQEIAERLVLAEDGKSRMFVMRDSLAHEPDANLRAASRPTCTAEEIDGWVWDTGCKKGERPVDRDNHGCDAARYLAKHLAERRSCVPGSLWTGKSEDSASGEDIMKRHF
jgi:phage terminase large subunit